MPKKSRKKPKRERKKLLRNYKKHFLKGFH